MSRLAKQPIAIPAKTEITLDGNVLTVKGSKGTLTRKFERPNVTLEIKDNTVVLTPQKEDQFTGALWGTYAAHVHNMIKGVNEGFSKKLIIEGVGFKVALNGKTLEMALGFSHPVKITLPEGLEAAVEKNSVVISGIDKELVGSFTADIRSKKKPEPYKGKGIRYDGEIIRRKQGKKSV